MRGLGKVDGHAQLSRQHGDPLHVVLMFVSDQQGIDGRRIFIRHLQAFEQFPAGEPRIHQDACPAAGHQCAVPLGAGGQHRHPHHAKSIRSLAVDFRAVAVERCHPRHPRGTFREGVIQYW